MYIEFTVTNQHLIRTDENIVVEKSLGFLKAKFSFSTAWDGKIKTAIFTFMNRPFAVILTDDECLVPSEVIKAGSFTVHVVCSDDQVIPTNKQTIAVLSTGAISGVIPETVTPDIYQQLITLVEGINLVPGKSAYEIAVGNGFIGTEAEWVDSLNMIESVNGLSGEVILNTDNIEPTETRRCVPQIPLEPDTKFLSGSGIFRDIPTGSVGYASNLYLSTIDSDVPSYGTLTYIADLSETEVPVTITAAQGEVLAKSYLYPSPIATSLIPAGLWKSSFTCKLSSLTGTTTARVECFLRHIDNTETVLFSKSSEDLPSTEYITILTETTRGSFSVEPTDRIGFRIFATTSRTVATTITFIVGDGRGAYFSVPIPLRHSQLRDKNEESEYQHISLTQKEGLHTHDGTVLYTGAANSEGIEYNLSEAITSFKEVWLYMSLTDDTTSISRASMRVQDITLNSDSCLVTLSIFNATEHFGSVRVKFVTASKFSLSITKGASSPSNPFIHKIVGVM